MISHVIGGNIMKKDKDFDFRKKWIRWALDFSRMDFQESTLKTLKNLKEEIAFFCSERPREESEEHWQGFIHALSLLTEEEYKQVTEIDYPELKRMKENTLKLLDDLNKTNVIIDIPQSSSFIETSIHGLKIYRLPENDSREDWFILNFVGLIEKFETYPIKKCKGCYRFFMHLTKIKKEYCSSSCASRSIQKAKREAIYLDRDKHIAFNEKMNKYQQERYKEKIKARLGQKVSVGRNSANH
jgi:hypothetical protein